MNKILTTLQSTALVLKKSKTSFAITNRILLGNKNLNTEETEKWILELWAWADENKIPDLEWIEDSAFVFMYNGNNGYWRGLSRNKEKLLSMTELALNKFSLKDIPKEISNLKKLTSLRLDGNTICEIPKDICSLNNLTSFWINNNNFTKLPEEILNLNSLQELSLHDNVKLSLSEKQKQWIFMLKISDPICIVTFNNTLIEDPFDRFH